LRSNRISKNKRHEGTGLLSNTIAIMAQEMEKPARVYFSKVYNKQIDNIATALRPFGKVRTGSDAKDAKAAGTAPAQPGIA